MQSKEIEAKERYDRKLREEEQKNRCDIDEVTKLEEVEKDLLSRLKHTQAKEQQSLIKLNKALDEQRSAAKQRMDSYKQIKEKNRASLYGLDQVSQKARQWDQLFSTQQKIKIGRTAGSYQQKTTPMSVGAPSRSTQNLQVMRNADLKNNLFSSKGSDAGLGYGRMYDSQQQLLPLELSQDGSVDKGSSHQKYSSYKGSMRIKTNLLKPIPISNIIQVQSTENTNPK